MSSELFVRIGKFEAQAQAFRESVDKANSCHNASDGQFCSGGGGTGGAVGSKVVDLVRGGGSIKDPKAKAEHRKKIASALNGATGDEMQAISDSFIRQGYKESKNPELKHLWSEIRFQGTVRGAKLNKEGYLDFV